MALSVGDKVVTKLRSSVEFIPGTLARLNPQPPVFGVVVAVNGGALDVVVLAENGTVVPPTGDLPFLAFELVTPPVNSLRDLFLNKIILPLGYSQEYTARVVDIVQLSNADTLALIETVAICRTLKGAMWFITRIFGNVTQDPEILPDR